MRYRACVILALALCTLSGEAAAQRPARRPVARPRPAAAPAAPGCPTPRVSLWEAIRDTLWPLIRHADGDQAFAHLAPAGLPTASATWCNPLAADPQAAQAGADLFVQHCASCHGTAGKGDGPGAGVEEPGPYDFTRPEFAGMREPPGPAVLYAIVTRGIEGTTMRGHGDVLSGWERLALIAYVSRMPGPSAVAAARAWADSLRARRQ